jgi:hypothetical protein
MGITLQGAFFEKDGNWYHDTLCQKSKWKENTLDQQDHMW